MLVAYHTSVSRLLCALLLLLLHLVGMSEQIKCFKAVSPPLLHPLDLVQCNLGTTSCYEYVYAYNISPNLMYAAGCGAQVPDFAQSARATLTVRRVKNCHNTDACNLVLREELLATSRICSFAVASRSVGDLTVACLPYESRCYFEQSTSAVPFYNAGCGTCPFYTLTCFTCSSNRCNVSDAPTAHASEKSTRPTSSASASVASPLMALLLCAGAVGCLTKRLAIG